MEITERSLHHVEYHSETVSVNLAVVDCPYFRINERWEAVRIYTLILTYTRINNGAWDDGKWALVGWVNRKSQRETNIRPEHFRDGCTPPAWCEEYLAQYREDLIHD